MKHKWIKTKIPGVRYREHPTRKHGMFKDKYFTIRYKLSGRDKEEALGWASNGWTEKKSAARLAELKENQRIGIGEKTLAEKRRMALEKKKNEETAQIKAAKDSVTFSSVLKKYIEQSRIDKNQNTNETEKYIFNKWFLPLLGELPIKDISPFILEKLKKQMNDAGLAPATITRDFAVISQVFSYAKKHDLYNGDNPTTKVKKPSQDNRRSRFLSHEEADLLLEELGKISPVTHDISLLSLHCGLRAGEIFSLTWKDIDLKNKTILIKDTKSGRNRNALMTENVKVMFEKRMCQKQFNFIFSSKNGNKIKEVSRTFDRIIDNLGINRGIADRRQRVVFHSLRHTYASWLVMSGVDLYMVQKLMGHSTIAMTERYSHLAPDYLKKAVFLLENNIKQNKESNVVNFQRALQMRKNTMTHDE
ncbi:MAG: site-specific integrase [Holosporaceae bacterium]|nr:site-specific integrase [Holosporaceae bacterium]